MSSLHHLEVSRQLALKGYTVILASRDLIKGQAAAEQLGLENIIPRHALTKMLAVELRGTKILVNSVCTGWVATDMGGHGGRSVEAGAASVL